ncbi:MAG TPA: hypothetical protein PKD72_09985 [Gemmatales bacterium]|nr:hypothetical protein [Gemmatales bacterium]
MTSSPPERAPIPGWLLKLIIFGVPACIITMGLWMGATLVELVMFSLLCLFGIALVYFMR